MQNIPDTGYEADRKAPSQKAVYSRKVPRHVDYD